jgi:copper chaperone CopZ
MIKKIFPILGMHCASCKVLIEESVRSLRGVSFVNVNFATEKMTIEYDENITDINKIADAVASAGSYQMIESGDH